MHRFELVIEHPVGIEVALLALLGDQEGIAGIGAGEVMIVQRSGVVRGQRADQ